MGGIVCRFVFRSYTLQLVTVLSEIRVSSSIRPEQVAEGVESEEKQKILVDYSCDIFQGFYRQKSLNTQQTEKILDKKVSYVTV